MKLLVFLLFSFVVSPSLGLGNQVYSMKDIPVDDPRFKKVLAQVNKGKKKKLKPGQLVANLKKGSKYLVNTGGELIRCNSCGGFGKVFAGASGGKDGKISCKKCRGVGKIAPKVTIVWSDFENDKQPSSSSGKKIIWATNEEKHHQIRLYICNETEDGVIGQYQLYDYASGGHDWGGISEAFIFVQGLKLEMSSWQGAIAPTGSSRTEKTTDGMKVLRVFEIVEIPKLSVTPRLLRLPTPAYWLNTETNHRHNRSCQFFRNTIRGRYCERASGEPCENCNG